MGWGKESPLPGKECPLVGEENMGITLMNIHSLPGCLDWTREGLISSGPGFRRRILSFGQHVASTAPGDSDPVELSLFSTNILKKQNQRAED